MKLSEHVYLAGSEQFGLSHALDCNCYLIDGGSSLALIDTGLGLGVEEILANITADGFEPERLTDIFITHSHIGHWGGANALRARTGACVWAHEGAAPRMASIDNDAGIRINLRFGRYPAGFRPEPCRVDRTFRDGECLKAGNIELRAILTKGHTADSTCFLFHDAGTRALLTGDVVFYGGKLGLLNLEGCSFSDYRRDMPKLAGLNVDMLLPGHGVFVLRRGQKHIDRAIYRLSDFVLPESFFETNEFMWDREYLRTMAGTSRKLKHAPRAPANY